MELDEELKKIVKAFGLEDPGHNPQVIPVGYFGRGSFGLMGDVGDFNLWVRRSLTTGWHFNEMWSDGFREVWWNPEKLAILTYCEGDVDLTVDNDSLVFIKRWEAAKEFYGEY